MDLGCYKVAEKFLGETTQNINHANFGSTIQPWTPTVTRLLRLFFKSRNFSFFKTPIPTRILFFLIDN